MRTLAGFLCKFLPGIVLAVLLPSLPTHGYAQSSSASLSVTVSDPSGAMVSDANVVIRNSDTNQEQKARSGRSGTATFSFLKPGRYSLTISKETFSEIAVDNLVLNVGDDRKLQQTLRLGRATESVTVDGSGPTVNTTDGSVGVVLDRRFVENTPLNGRSFQDLILLTPGVITQSPQQAASAGANGDFSVNGQRTESNNYSIDGISANTSAGVGGTPAGANISGNVASSTALGTTQSLVSVDALQEFRVNSSSYSAEYGRTPGGQFSFVTRSGTNDLHGSLFEYLRNDVFDSSNWFDNYYGKPKQALRQSDFGGTLGGPVRIPGVYNGKDRTFFFFSYEGLRLMQPQAASLQYVPSLSLRRNPLVPAALQPILNAFPQPTVGGIDYNNGLAQFIQGDSLPSQIDATSVRVDHSLSSKIHLFFRFSDSPSSTTTRSLSVLSPVSFGNHSYTLGATAQLNDHIGNDFRVGYVINQSAQLSFLDTFGGAVPINLPGTLAGATGKNAEALFDFLVGSDFTSMSTQDATNQMNQLNVTNTLSWFFNKHQFKFGVDYRHIRAPIVPRNPSITYIYEEASQILTNEALEAEALVELPATPIFVNFSAFAQDEWHVSKRVSLSLGLRWEVNPPMSAGNGNLPYVLQGSLAAPASLSLAPQGTPLWKTTWYNFAPRAGVAWIAHNAQGRETVVRAGGGIFFDTGNQDASQGYGGVGFTTYKIVSNAPAPFPGGVTLVPSANPPYTNATAYGIYPHLQLPATLEWSTAIEQGIGQNQTLTLTYVGSNGRRLLTQSSSSITKLNPEFGTVVETINGPTSNYQSLQAKFQRTISHGVQTLASYTWSHSIDYGSYNSALPIVRGNSDFDLRNNLAAGVTWQIPTAFHSPVAKTILSNWALDGHFIAHSGFPVPLQGNTLTDPTTGSRYYGGVNLVPDQPIYKRVTGIPGGREINASAFMLPTGNQSGDAPRNFARGFGATQFNLAARHNIALSEDLNLQFRAETFNILNHPNFGLIDATLQDTTFGQATQTLNQSLGTTSSLYQMGGPRSMQFAVRAQF